MIKELFWCRIITRFEFKLHNRNVLHQCPCNSLSSCTERRMRAIVCYCNDTQLHKQKYIILLLPFYFFFFITLRSTGGGGGGMAPLCPLSYASAKSYDRLRRIATSYRKWTYVKRIYDIRAITRLIASERIQVRSFEECFNFFLLLF